MEFKDVKHGIYNNLLNNYKYSYVNSWRQFVKSLDIGILFVRCYCDEAKNDVGVYKIIDEKKWLMSKLKYGI